MCECFVSPISLEILSEILSQPSPIFNYFLFIVFQNLFIYIRSYMFIFGRGHSRFLDKK